MQGMAVLLSGALTSLASSAREPETAQAKVLLSGPGSGVAIQVQKVNIFGDGNPANGIEDSRIDMSAPGWNVESRRPWNMGAGTVHCDGQNRGSAMIVDTREFGRLSTGLIIATSAHVLYDLERQRRFSACRFHYMALDHLPGYQAAISLKQSLLGGFDPSDPRNTAAFGKEDWAFLYVAESLPGLPATGRLRLKAYQQTLQADSKPFTYQFIAYSPSVNSITISTACRVLESEHGDLGGGEWAGQLLDDCDSEGGASGGALVASAGGDHYLVGIRSGSHWDKERYPQQKYPGGPPDGAAWDIFKNTNFSRAIDDELIAALRALIHEIDRESTKNDVF
jgi:hypothetical protein